MPWLRRVSQWCLALAALAGCTTVATRHEVSVPPPEDQLPPTYPRLEDYGLQGRPFDYNERAPYNRDVNEWFAPPPADQPQPKLACDEPNLPIRTLWKGQELSSAWEIRNAGGAPLRILIDV